MTGHRWLLLAAVATATTSAPCAVPLPGPPAGSGEPEALTAATCVERIPEGKQRPTLKETFPSQGKSGHQAVLVVLVHHGPGEHVLPSTLDLDRGSPVVRALQAAGFRFPSGKGPGRPQLSREEHGQEMSTRFSLPVLLLPPQAGRQEMTLPPLPIAIARASGEIITACTLAHTIVVEDPTANQPNAGPKPNPAPGRQQELHTALRNALYGGALGLLLATLVGFLIRALRKRPKKLPPPPPPRPAWEVALEALADIQRAGWVESGRFGEHFDQVSHVLRRYLGDRFGFDALESTTGEVLAALADRQLRGSEGALVQRFLNESDLVKFANLTPTEAQCHWLWESAQELVLQTKIAPAPEVRVAPEQESRGGL